MRIRPAVIVSVLALAATACAGPTAPLEIGAKEIPVNITLGDQASPPPRPPAETPGPIGFPGFIEPPIPRIDPGVPQPVPSKACPIANPLDAALLVARLEAPRPPVERSYRFRNRGWFQTADGPRIDMPATTTRTVVDVTDIGDGNFEYGVATTIASETTTTTYRVLNGGDLPQRGIFIIGIVTESSSGSTAFIPRTPIMLMPFPPPEYGTNLEDEIASLQGEDYRSTGTDPISQTTMTLEAKVAGKARVDACGEWVDAFDIEVISGRIVGPNKQIEFTGSYGIAPQYGGLVVEDDLHVTGMDAFQNIESRNRARINRVPAEP